MIETNTMQFISVVVIANVEAFSTLMGNILTSGCNDKGYSIESIDVDKLPEAVNGYLITQI